MRAARRQGALGVVRCGTGHSSRMRAHDTPVQHLLRGGYKRSLHEFQDAQRHHGRFGAPDEEKGAGGEPVLATPLWGVVYADDTGAVSQSPEQLKKITVVGRARFQNADRKVDYSDQ